MKDRGKVREMNSYKRKKSRRHDNEQSRSDLKATILPILAVCVLSIVIAMPIIWFITYKQSNHNQGINNEQRSAGIEAISDVSAAIEKADQLAAMYDYEGATEWIDQSLEVNPENEDLLNKKAKYIEMKEELVEYTGEVSHVFFHSLIVDTQRCFDGYPDMSIVTGYNNWMTTLDEFNKMMKLMYENGYVIVKTTDFCEEVQTADGKTTYIQKAILLPEGKKPFVISQDDVNYYDYMKYDGFASRFVFDENGNVKNLYVDQNGNELIGDYDLVSALDTFIDEHPDFSYKGAKGYIGETGYEGALGYDTHIKDSPTYDEDCEMVRKIAKALREDGWEFASHSYGHGRMQKQSFEELKIDADKWEDEVGSLVGPVDVYIYPFGDYVPADSWKFKYLQSKGFKYFFGVGARTYNAFHKDYVFMDRCNLDGYSMNYRPELLSKYFNTSLVLDSNRPAFEN